MLDGGDARDGIGVASLLGSAAVDDAGLVEVDVGFDQSGAGQVALGVILRRGGGKAGGDCNDPAARDTDVDQQTIGQDARCG